MKVRATFRMMEREKQAIVNTNHQQTSMEFCQKLSPERVGKILVHSRLEARVDKI